MKDITSGTVSGDTEAAFSKTQTLFQQLSETRERCSSDKGYPPKKPRAAIQVRGEMLKALPVGLARRQSSPSAKQLGSVSPEVTNGSVKQNRLCSQKAWLCAKGCLKSLWRNDASEFGGPKICVQDSTLFLYVSNNARKMKFRTQTL